jgi:FMN phosphatase YigB (HAD superfamily)
VEPVISEMNRLTIRLDVLASDMPKTLLEYSNWLDERDLLWPAPPSPEPIKATPFLDELPDIRAVTWGGYGTLLRVADGRLLPMVDEPLRMEVALEKTIHEFNMWHSMSRKPGAPWEYMLQQMKRLVEDHQLAGSGHKGEAPEVDLAQVWRKLIERLLQKDFEWDQGELGDLDEFSDKVAYFFNRCLQGVTAAPHARMALRHVHKAGCMQGFIADGQVFTPVQLIRELREQGATPALSKIFSTGCICLSYEFGVRQPAPTLFKACLTRLAKEGIRPGEVLHLASRLAEELGPAKKLGMKTALYAGDKSSVQATGAEINDPDLRPDRILTDLAQIRQIVPGE